MRKIGLVMIAIAITFFVSCNNSSKKSDTEVQKNETGQAKESVKKDCKDVHWSHHQGTDGPENWENLCDGFSACGHQSQSPVNISVENATIEESFLAPKFSYGKTKVDIINNSHTVQFNVDGENTVELNGKNYKLLQFHYHALSEHTVDGEHFPLEVHFVHKHSDTDFAVLGVMFVEGKSNELFEKYLAKFPTSKGEYRSDELISLLSLFPENKSYYHYGGSLTTPPCSEVVSWYVLENPVEASKQQIEKFSKILNENYRPIKPLNDRKILMFRE